MWIEDVSYCLAQWLPTLVKEVPRFGKNFVGDSIFQLFNFLVENKTPTIRPNALGL